VVEKLLIEEQSSDDFSGPTLRAYPSPTCDPLREKLQRHADKEALCCFVLCRVIIVDQSSEKSKTFFNQAASCYEIKDRNLIYPEYIMLARPVLGENACEHAQQRLDL